MAGEPLWLQAVDVALLLAIVAFVLQKAIRIRRETSFGRALAAWNGLLALIFAWALIRRLLPDSIGNYGGLVLRGVIVVVLAWGEWEFHRIDRDECDAICRESRRRAH